MQQERHSQTPEEALAGLHEGLLRLYWRLKSDDENAHTDIDAHLVEALRLAEQTLVLNQDFLVAVAGPQGVGKTTLVREIYGLEDDLFGGNLGRGERMPVVVREREGHIGPPRLWIRTLRTSSGAGATIGEEEIPAAERARWINATRGQLSAVLVVGVDVAATFFGTDGMGFLVLPGYEDDLPANRSWQRLMRLAMVTSPSLIVVADHGRLAVAQDDTVIRDLGKVTSGAIRPLVAVTRTEGMAEEARRNARERAVEVFGSVVSADDVVLTGAGDPAYRDSWSKELLQRLDVDRRDRPALRDQQLRNLESGLREPLRKVFRKAQLELDKQSVSTPEAANYRSWMDAFGQERLDAKAQYEEQVDRALDERHARAVRELEKHLDETGGWKYLGSQAWGWFSARSSEFNRKQNDAVLDIWNRSYDPLRIGEAARRAQVQVVNGALPTQPDGGGPQELTDGSTTGKALAVLAAPPEHVMTDLRFIAGNTVGAGELEPGPLFKESVRLLPAIGLENLAVVRDPRLTALAQTKRGTSDEELQQFEEAIGDLKKTRKLVIYGLGALLGADLLVDGNIDSVPAVAGVIHTALFGSSATAGGATAAAGASTAATALSIGILGAAAAAAVVSVADRMTSKREERAAEILHAARGVTRANLSKEFDGAMDFVRERLEARLRGYLQIDAADGRALRLQGALAQAEESFEALRDACEAEHEDLG